MRVPVHAQGKVPSERTAELAEEHSEGMHSGAVFLGVPPEDEPRPGDIENAYAAMRDDRLRKVARLRMAEHTLERAACRGACDA